MPEQILYSPRVVARLFDCTVDTVRRLCGEGRIPAVNLGSIKSPRWRVPLSFLTKAMCGAARWKYPRFIKRHPEDVPTLMKRLDRVTAEVQKEREVQGMTWEDEEDGEG